jgi:hypothetical protein
MLFVENFTILWPKYNFLGQIEGGERFILGVSAKTVSICHLPSSDLLDVITTIFKNLNISCFSAYANFTNFTDLAT